VRSIDVGAAHRFGWARTALVAAGLLLAAWLLARTWKRARGG
jgi:hypothetical protein